MASLIEELLTVSRIERGQIELEIAPFDLNAALRDTIDEIGLTTSDFVLHVDEQSQHLWVRGDRGRIQRVLTNLLNNAIKYSKQRQEIRISIRRDEMQAVVSVTDYGIGILEHQQAHVFDLYFRAENAPTKHYAGLGLGMYISKNIIDRHGGTIGLSSEEDQGSTFWFSLPLMETLDAESDTREGG
jgi:signal transduction histidine kinase